MLAAQSTRRLVPGLPRTQKALVFAERMHAGQTRKVDGAPFILHPIEVTSILVDAGLSDEVIAAGALHDILEKTSVDAAQLLALFGGGVTSLVLALTEDDTIADYDERKAALREQVAAAGEDALTVFAADKISKVRELQLPAARPGTRVSRSRKRHLAHYHECLRLLEERLRDSPLVAELRAEFERVLRAFNDVVVPAGVGVS